MIKKIFLNDRFILFLILVNALILFMGGFVKEGSEKFILTLADNIITTLFIAELAVKFHEYGPKGYFASNWNKFDFVLIVLSIPSLIAFVLSLKLANVGFLLVFRTMRVFKSFRFFKFIPDIGHLILGIKRALKASVFIFLGFVICIFIIGLLSYYLFESNPSGYFRNPVVSLYSIFKIFTVEGWFEIPEQITLEYSPMQSFFTYIYFIFVVLSGGIIGLSLINSIFVDSMVSDNTDNLEAKIDDLNEKVSELLARSQNDDVGEAD